MVWIVSSIELLLLIYLIYKYVKTKSIFILLVTIITFGLFYDAFITSLGTIIDASNILVLSKIRFILHSTLVPLLFIISERALNLKKAFKITIYITTLVLIVLGLVSVIFTHYEVIQFAGISRLTLDKESTNKFFSTLPTIINIVAVIPLIAARIYVLIKEKNVHQLLSGAFMFIFSAIGPMLKLSDFIFLLSMIGEILMVLFQILYFNKKNQKE